MIAAEIIRSVNKLRIDRIVVPDIGTVIVGFRVSVVTQELQALRKALFKLYLESVIVRAGVVSEVVADIG